MAKRTVAVSRVADDALHVLGGQVRLGRHRKGWTASDLAARIGVSPRTVTAIETGNPGVAVGSVLNAAATVGVPLFASDVAELSRMRRHGEEILALLPSRTYRVPDDRGDPDDFDF